MIKTKVAVVAALAVASALVLSACSSGGTGGGGEDVKNEVGISGLQSQIEDIQMFCGTGPIKVAFADGFGGNSWRKTTRAIFEKEAAKCKNITDIIYTDANADTQKAIADINSLVAQGVNVIVSFTDGGDALLPTIKKAMEAGTAFVPIIACPPAGVAGVDFVDCVSEDVNTYGYGLATWTIKQMGGKGNLIMTGGTAGNSYSQAVYDGVKKAVAENPGVNLLNVEMGDIPVETGWEPGKTKEVMAGLITKYNGAIDGIVADYGGGSVGGIEAFIAAGVAVPPWSANDSNQFACLWYQYKDTQPKFQVATESSRNWMGVPALHKGLAWYNKLANSEPSIYNLEIIEDSTNPDLMPICEKDLPNDAINSSGLSVDELNALFK